MVDEKSRFGWESGKWKIVMKKNKNTFKKNVAAGLLVIIPAGLTLFLFTFVIASLDHALEPIIVRTLKLTGFVPAPGFKIPGLGLTLILIAIFLVGLFVKNFFGKKTVEYWHITIDRIPFVRSIYLTIKKILDAVTLTNTLSFKQVVLIEYPREGMKSIGIVSGKAKEEVIKKLQGDQVCVFVPTTPNPTTGFTVILPKDKLIPLDMTVDQGLKMIVSVGMYNPGQ
tara:strand:- start:672 stop:1349 length:678 start_codon:yes stop_codon:yes gene_type:complete